MAKNKSKKPNEDTIKETILKLISDPEEKIQKKSMSKKRKKSKKSEYNSKDKSLFRQSEEWQEFRLKKFQEQKEDFLTKSKLQPKANLHHLDMSSENYENLSNSENFVLLNPRTHKFLHFAFTYYKKDKEFLNRLKELLDKMISLN